MTLQKTILFVFAAITLATASAGAYIIPGPRPDPGRPGYPPDHGGGRQEQRSTHFNTRVINSTIDILQATRIGYELNGYAIESVVVDMRGSSYGTTVSLLTNGMVSDSVNSPQGRIILRPRNRAVLGQDLRNLGLDVRGIVDMTGITVNLVREGRPGGPGYPGNPGYPGYEETIDLNVSRRLYGNERLDLTYFIDMNRYRGYRIQSIDIDAQAAYNVALIDVFINGFSQGQTVQVDSYRRLVSIRPQNAVLGQGADSIVLGSRGDLDINRITLRLSR